MVPTDDRKLLATAGTEARRASFGPGGGIGIPAERSDKFGTTLKRLGDILGTEKPRLFAVFVLTVVSVVLVVIGPRLLGNATNIIVDGVVGGGGIDFDELHRQLIIVMLVYVGSFVLQYTSSYVLAGVVQRSMFSLRQEVERKLNHLPLSYIDRQPRGDLLSRVTNDIDNLSQSLQQTTSQILTALLTLLGVTVMMFTISPLLALGCAHHRAAVGVADEVHRRQGAPAVHGAVAPHRRPQRAGRGGVQRTRDREELRSPA